MSLLVKLVYDTSKVRCRYSRVHDRIFGFPLSRVVHLASLQRTKTDLQDLEELKELKATLDTIRDQLSDLDETDLTKRRGREIRDALLDYAAALEASVINLQKICQARRQVSADRHQSAYESSAYREDKIAYDDCIQHHKRLGERLTHLLSTF